MPIREKVHVIQGAELREGSPGDEVPALPSAQRAAGDAELGGGFLLLEAGPLARGEELRAPVRVHR